MVSLIYHTLVRQFQIMLLEPAHGDGGFVGILLPEQPAIHLRALKTIAWDQVRAFRQIEHNRIRLRQRPSIRPACQRHLPNRVQRQKFFGLRSAIQNINLNPVMVDIQIIGGPARLLTIARNAVAIKR